MPINAEVSKYNSLPGMILELHENYISYMAQNVSFNTVSDISLPNLPIITLEEYLKEFDNLKKEKLHLFPKEVFN